MKNNFQSKSVPRGTRTIWRYLGALFLLFTFAIGNVWAADPTHASPSIVKVANRHFLNLGSTPSNVTVSTDSYSNYGPGYFISNKSADLSESWWSFTGTFKSNGSTYSNVSGAVGFHAVGSSTSSEFYQILQLREGSGRMTQMDFYVTGTTQIGFQWKNANTSGAKYLEFAIYEMNVSGTTATDGASPVSTIQGSTTSDADQYAASAALDGAKYYHVVVTPHNTSNLNFYGLTFKHAPAASYTITYDKNGGEGTMENSTNTVSACTFTAPTGKEFKEWNTLATGLGDSYDPGDAASSDLDLFAIWQTKVEKFTVKYMDGTTELGSEVVEVGQHPTGSEIAAPTKDCYTFAGWDPALSGVSGSDGDEVVVNATWTPNYAFGAYSFVNVAEVGTAPNKLTMSDGNTVNVPAGSRVDNFYFSAMAIKYESGASTALTDYKGWKINTKDATIKFLVENNSQVKVAIGSKDAINVTYTEPDGTAKNAISQGQQTEVSYLAKAGTLFTIKTATANTTTLKRITISPLYNATYTTSKSSVDPTSASNVTEVTLPTPSETTVGGYSFTGWIANQTVYKGETAKTAGEGLDAGETYTLTDNTAFTAQWQLISDFDVKFFQGYGDPDVQIGETQSISTGNYATAPTPDPTREGYNFKGWSYDATEAHIVDVASYAITAATNFTAIWKQVFAVTFDGAGSVNVESGSRVASPDSPTQAGKVFQGWYNGESKYDFSAAVTGALTLTSKWVDADPNHFVYAYNDDFHFDGVVYKTPEGKVDNNDLTSNKAITTPYTLFSGAGGITSIVATGAIYDSKGTHVNAFLKLDTKESSYLTVTIASGYTAVMKVKMGSWNVGSAAPTVTFVDEDDTPVSYTGTMEGKAEDNNYAELTYNLSAGTYKMTTATKTLYFSNMDIEATALPTHTVTYKAGEGTGDDVEDADATEVADCPGTFTAPTGKVFNGWKNESDDSDVAVGAIVEDDMNLIAQWINVYAVTFNMNDHGDAPAEQDIKHGEKATKPADPSEIGWIFGGWFTDNGTFEAPFDFETPITAATPLFAKWTADPCPDKKSIVKAVMATNTTATVTGYNSNEYAGGFIINNLADDASNTNMYDFGEGEVKGFKLKGSNSAIFATLAKGGFVAGDQVVFAVTKNAGDNKLAIYAAKDKDNVLKLVELDVAAAGIYTYRLTQDNVDAIEAAGSGYLSIGTFRGDYNPYIYSVELKGCRSWSVFHTLTFKNIDGTTTIAAESLEEGAAASTVAPAAPKIAMKRFLGWAEAIDGTPVELTSYTITEDKTLYAVYEDIVCPTTGTVYKFQLKTDLTNGNIFTSAPGELTLNTTDHLSSMVNGEVTVNLASGKNTNRVQFYDGKAIGFANGDGASITLTLDCALATGDEIRFINYAGNGNKMNLSDGTHSLELNGNSAETVQKITVNSDWNGADELTLTRGGNTPKLTYFEIYRPAKFTVSFDLKGHGAAIADLTNVPEGSKITAPTAPTDENFSFSAWYKETTLENVWNFAEDVVTANTTLFAKWIDKSDATLKSLKYGSFDIALENDVYEYNIGLPSATVAVPALTAETNNPLATAAISDATEFDGEGKATSTVEVTPEKEGAAHQTYTVHFTILPSLPQVTVAASTLWDFSLAGNTALQNQTDVVLANMPGIINDATFNAQALKGSFNKLPGNYFQGSKLMFEVEEEGLITIEFSGTNNNARNLQVCTGDEGNTVIAEWAYNNGTHQTKSIEVPAGKITLKAFEGESANNVRIYNLEYLALADRREAAWVAPGELGTVCLKDDAKVLGANVFKVMGCNASGYMVFDEILSGEIEAGKPYLFEVTRNGSVAFFKTVGATHTETAESDKGMIGTFDGETLHPGTGNYCYFSGRHIWRVNDFSVDITVPAYCCYVDYDEFKNNPIPTAAPAPGLRRVVLGVNGKDEAQGFENIENGDAPMKIMIDGTLYILRGEKVFDATGRLVK